MANTFLDAESRAGLQLTRTFDLATAMQEALMPDERPVRRPAFELRGMYRPVAECGGDLWLWRELGDGRVLVLIGDATGHGAAPALLAAMAKGAVDACWQLMGADLDPGELLVSLNRSIFRASHTRYLMTAFAVVLDKAAGTVRYANAGQNFPYLITAPPTERLEVLIARGNALGAAAEVRYETRERSLVMGERIILYTDGIIDAGAPQIEPFGEKRLRAVLSALAHERAVRLPELLLAEVERYLAGAQLADDITLAAVELGPTARAAES
jgi:sigma-B regulation protein RsbU (phosphoserine phosphatase)